MSAGQSQYRLDCSGKKYTVSDVSINILQVELNEETGQTILSGMGELHLDIIKSRLEKEYKLDVELGPLQIAYREAILTDAGKQIVTQFELLHFFLLLLFISVIIFIIIIQKKLLSILCQFTCVMENMSADILWKRFAFPLESILSLSKYSDSFQTHQLDVDYDSDHL